MSSLDPLLNASPAIQLHAAAACAAAIFGLIVFLRPKGTRWHRVLGKGFVLAMGTAALSSFFIHEIRSFGLFSAIHLLSIAVLFSLVQSIWAIRHGQVRQHRQAMIGTYIGGIIVAGGFTFLPGRIMARVTYGGTDQDFPVIWIFLVLAGIWLVERLWRNWRAGRRVHGN